MTVVCPQCGSSIIMLLTGDEYFCSECNLNFKAERKDDII